MNQFERFNAVMNFQKPDRIPMIEWAGYWDKTLTNWYTDGLPKNLEDPADIRAHLGLDTYLQFWVGPRNATCPEPPFHGAGLMTEGQSYELLKDFHFPKPAFDRQTIESWAEMQQNGDAVIWITFEGFFWFPRSIFGIEKHMYAFFDQPELIPRMNRDIMHYNLEVLDEFCQICTPNFMTFAEDMSYNLGPMLSKDCFDEYLAPYYQKVVPELKKRNIRVFVDSDGDVSKIIPWLKEVGIEGILPLERMAGVDVGQIRRDHPDFRMIGGFDKMIMHQGPAAIEKEFERLLPTMRSGGYIPSVDHQTPPDVLLKNYRHYLRLLEKYCNLAVQ